MTSAAQPHLSLRAVVPLFELPAANRQQPIGPWHYKQRSNLVLIFVQHSYLADQDWLLALAQQYELYRALETEILIISTEALATLQVWSERHAIAVPVLSDETGRVHRAYLGDAVEPLPVGLFICDRYGELYMQTLGANVQELPTEPAIREWVEFVDLQCPECFPPDWR